MVAVFVSAPGLATCAVSVSVGVVVIGMVPTVHTPPV